MSGPLAGRSVAYLPYSDDLTVPGDRRRFCWYARERDVGFAVGRPAHEPDLVYVTSLADIATWADYRGPAKVVFELIDSYLAAPRWSPRSLLRGAARWATRGTSRLLLDYHKGIETMCRRADAVVCSTEEQRQQLVRLCSNVHVILDVHDELGGARKDDHAGTETLRLVWEGLPQNLVGFEEVADVLTDLTRERPVSLDLVTDERTARWMDRFGWRATSDLAQRIPVPTTIHPWSPANLAARAIAADLAIIPLRHEDPFAMGKPENKLLIFWRLGVPTLTSASPAYRRAMAAAGLDDMACADATEWAQALRRYGADADLRRDASAKGVAYVEAEHGHDHLLARWDELFASVLA